MTGNMATRTAMVNVQAICYELTDICNHYEKSAPTVHAWADELYTRIGEAPDKVTLAELLAVQHFRTDGEWLQPNFAANHLYHLFRRWGRNVEGQIGF